MAEAPLLCSAEPGRLVSFIASRSKPLWTETRTQRLWRAEGGGRSGVAVEGLWRRCCAAWLLRDVCTTASVSLCSAC